MAIEVGSLVRFHMKCMCLPQAGADVRVHIQFVPAGAVGVVVKHLGTIQWSQDVYHILVKNVTVEITDNYFEVVCEP